MDGAAFLKSSVPDEFDLIYADAGPGKFTHLDLALSLLRMGGIYLVDDLLPQESWPEGHAPKVPALIADLAQRRGFVSTQFSWAKYGTSTGTQLPEVSEVFGVPCSTSA